MRRMKAIIIIQHQEAGTKDIFTKAVIHKFGNALLH